MNRTGRGGGPSLRSPLATWFADDDAIGRFRDTTLGRQPVVLPAADDQWTGLAPPFERCVDLAAAGVPFHVVAERDHDAAPDPRRLRDALAGGATVLLPQAHQVLPRVARLMVALRAALTGPARDESSYLFLVEGTGREGMGLHHDGAVDAFWLQLGGRRTVTIGPRAARGTPEDLDDARVQTDTDRWQTRALDAGTLAYLPAYTPHRVVCHGRSLALTLTWTRGRRRALSASARAHALIRWDVTSGRAEPWPPDRSTGRLWTQVPVVAGRVRRGWFRLLTPEGVLELPAAGHDLAARLAGMPALEAVTADHDAPWLRALIEAGVLADEDLPLVIVPSSAADLEGWRFG